MKDNKIFEEVLSLILPSVISEHFILVGVDGQSEDIVFSFEEKNEVQNPEPGHVYRPNGFLPECRVQDFPIRDKKTTLVIKRRRWTDVTSGKNHSNSYSIAAEGTRYSEEFAAFLKSGFVLHGNIVTFP